MHTTTLLITIIVVLNSSQWRLANRMGHATDHHT
jgi:hypothetical protein